jgi:hypothetical protein
LTAASDATEGSELERNPGKICGAIESVVTGYCRFTSAANAHIEPE